MTSLRQLPRAVPLALAVLTLLPLASAQEPETPKPTHHPASAKPTTPTINPNLIVLDPAHGGPNNGIPDDGAHLPNSLLEKDLNLTFANRLRDALTAKGFTVVVTRAAASDSDAAPTTETEDQRAEQANHLHPVACLLLHATSAGHGVHLFTSSLTPLTIADDSPAVLSWNEAQAPTVPQSLRLATDLSTAFNSARIPLVLGRASVSPIDSLTCPAVTIELAPLANTSPGDPAYQTRVADAITYALVFWRGHIETEATRAAAAAAAKAPEAPVKKPAPIKKPAPTAGDEAPRKPAPIVRRPPESLPPATPPPMSDQAGAR